MTAVLLTPPYLQFFDANGAPLAGGKVYTYTATGTFDVPKATYTNAAGTVEAANPVILDSSGRPSTGGGSIWLSGTYDIKVTDSLGNTIETTEDVTAFTTLPTASNAYFQSFSGTGAQTAFTTSSNLGTDEKAIYVWVDAGAGKGYDIINPSAYTINGTTLTFGAAPASGTNNIYVSAPSLLVGAASSSAADAAASAAAAAATQVAVSAIAATTIGVQTVTSTSNSTVLNLASYSAFKHTFTENTTFTFSNPQATGLRTYFELYLFQDGTGRTPTWPAAVKWSNGVAPTLTTASAKYVVSFITIDGGTTYIGSLVNEAYA